MGLLNNKTAVVSGGSSGIGLATAQRFIDEGATVIVTGRRRTELDAAAAQLGPHAHAVTGDVTVAADLERLYEAAAGLGGIDIVFANAGAPLGSITEEDFHLLFDINVRGVVFTVQTLLPLIREHGSIILNSSVAADRGRSGTSVYAATKAAVRSLARTWANELSSRGIRVNAVNPTSTETTGLMALNDADSSLDDDQFKAQRSQGIPLGRLATTDEVANAVLFLASGLRSFTTGAALLVDGGYNQI
jgi:NAD(P)-dependent dehydrogenase (short-subunit alcohol dehydrogenase family)